MKRKLYLAIGLFFILAACQTLLGNMRTTPTAALTATETARLSVTDLVVPTYTNTPTPTTTSTSAPTYTTTPTATSLPTQPPIATETATSTPKPPTPTSSPKPSLEILFFEANVHEADPGDTITLSWETNGAVTVTLYRLPPSHHMPQSGWDVPLTGSYNVTIPSEDRNYSEFLLYANNIDDSISRGLTVFLRCPDPWFFTPEPDVCASAPIYSFAAVQHFQHGVMLWIEKQDRIIVLYDDYLSTPKYANFQDEWDEGEPDRDPTIQPPEGLHQPIRGFGLVWRTYPEVRDRLGWAIAGEVGYNTIIQHTTRYKYNATYIRAADGNVWYLGPEGSVWEKIPIQP